MKVIINTRGRYEAISLNDFIKDYNLTPKCTGDRFYVIHQEGRDWFINSFPNPACIFSEGKFLYIIYKGNMQYVVNGVLMSSADFVEEQYIFTSDESAREGIRKIEDSHKGEMYIDCKDGSRIKINS